jgi:flagellar hook-associated protein 1 FlgK
MSGLNAALNIATQALLVDQAALATTTNNIANASTPGYSREVVELASTASSDGSGKVTGSGVTLVRTQAVRDEVLQLRILDLTQQQAKGQATLNAAQQLEALVSDPDQSLANAFEGFFDAVNQLSTAPTDGTLRQNVLTAAATISDRFNSLSRNVSDVQKNLNEGVASSVMQINQLLPRIAKLNGEVDKSEQLGKDAGAIEDQRDDLIKQLAGQIQIQSFRNEAGEMLTLPDGTPLVNGSHYDALATTTDADCVVRVLAGGRDITDSVAGGALGGTLAARDNLLPNTTTALDSLAASFSSAVNAANAGGFDSSGAAGGPIFNSVSGAGAARNIAVIAADASKIAASSDGSAGSAGNLGKLLSVRDSNLAGSSLTPIGAYSAFTAEVGSVTANAQTDTSGATAALQQAEDQRGSVSGVSLDEEAVNMIRYQRAFEASARVLSTIDQLTSTIIQLGAQ